MDFFYWVFAVKMAAIFNSQDGYFSTIFSGI